MSDAAAFKIAASINGVASAINYAGAGIGSIAMMMMLYVIFKR